MCASRHWQRATIERLPGQLSKRQRELECDWFRCHRLTRKSLPNPFLRFTNNDGNFPAPIWGCISFQTHTATTRHCKLILHQWIQCRIWHSPVKARARVTNRAASGKKLLGAYGGREDYMVDRVRWKPTKTHHNSLFSGHTCVLLP